MGYGSKSLGDLSDEAYAISKAHGFHDEPKSVAEDIALMHSELSEALEDYRKGHAPNVVWYEDKEGKRHDRPFEGDDVNRPRKPCGIPSEMADVVIRVLDFCGNHKIDIEQAVREKMFYNESRPHRHGGKIL